MANSRGFLDNLANLRLVMSVALEHIQGNREPFLKTATAEQVQQAQGVIARIQTLAKQLEQEFQALETSVVQRRRLM
ncbi:MAG TPA: hypothetical protein VKQ28_08420 [Candidatus Acidoferrum sp.]|nr:hypothetical protein [Candidatus Acidoferrum sp.]